MTPEQSYTNPRKARLYIVDNVLRRAEGGTYEDMLEMVANWPDEVKKRFNVVRCFKDLPESKKQEWDLMENEVERLVEIYAFFHGHSIPSKNGKAAIIKSVRAEFMEERQSRKGCRKTFRYKNPSYSVFDSGDYDRYMEYHDKAVVMVRGKEKAIRNRKSLDAFRKDLIKKGRERTTAYINQNIDTLHVRLSKQKTLGQVIPAELSDSIEAGIDKAFPASPVKMAFLLYYRAIYEIYNGFRNKAIEDLNKVIEICSRHPKHPGVNELLKSSSQLLKALAGEVSVEVTYENITSMWHKKGTRQTSSAFSKRLPVIHVTSAGSLRVFVQPSIYLDRVRTAGIRNTIVPLGIASQYRLRGPMNRFEDAKLK